MKPRRKKRKGLLKWILIRQTNDILESSILGFPLRGFKGHSTTPQGIVNYEKYNHETLLRLKIFKNRTHQHKVTVCGLKIDTSVGPQMCQF